MRCIAASTSTGDSINSSVTGAATGATTTIGINDSAKNCIAGENPVRTIGEYREGGGFGAGGRRNAMHRTFSAGISAMARSKDIRAATRAQAKLTDPVAERATLLAATDVAISVTGDASCVCIVTATSTRARFGIARIVFYQILKITLPRLDWHKNQGSGETTEKRHSKVDSMARTVMDESDFNLNIQSCHIVVVDFTANWYLTCMHCTDGLLNQIR